VSWRGGLRDREGKCKIMGYEIFMGFWRGIFRTLEQFQGSDFPGQGCFVSRLKSK
jgi:hypothetical protein